MLPLLSWIDGNSKDICMVNESCDIIYSHDNNNYFPWNISDEDSFTSCTSSGRILQLCQVLSVALRGCAYKIVGQTGRQGYYCIPPPSKNNIVAGEGL